MMYKVYAVYSNSEANNECTSPASKHDMSQASLDTCCVAGTLKQTPPQSQADSCRHTLTIGSRPLSWMVSRSANNCGPAMSAYFF